MAPAATVAALATLWLAGCASSAHSSFRHLPEPPGEEQRARFGRIALVLEDTRTPPAIATPGGEAGGAARGAAGGGLAVISIGAQAGPVGMIAGLFLSPLGMLVGGVYGACEADSREVEAAAHERIATAFRARPAEPALLDELARRARGEAGRELTVVPERWSHEPTSAQLAALRAAGCDSALVVRVDALGLTTADMSVNPALTFELYTTARLLRLTDGTVLHELPLRWSSGGQRFLPWSACAARDVRVALDAATAATAERIVDELFLLHLGAERATEHEEDAR